MDGWASIEKIRLAFNEKFLASSYLAECACDGKSSKIPQNERMAADEPDKIKQLAGNQEGCRKILKTREATVKVILSYFKKRNLPKAKYPTDHKFM